MTEIRGFGSFTGPQRAMLALLDEGPEEDCTGLEAEELTPSQIGVCERLAGRELVRFDIGWRHSCWFRLTPAGRDALDLLRVAGHSGRALRGARRDPVRTGIGGRNEDDRNRTRKTTYGQG